MEYVSNPEALSAQSPYGFVHLIKLNQPALPHGELHLNIPLP